MTYPVLNSLLEAGPMNHPMHAESVSNIADRIFESCDQWIKELGGDLSIKAWRGIDKAKAPDRFSLVSARTDRISTMDDDARERWNFAIKDSGKVANRSNSMFVVGHRLVAAHFGRPCVIVPMGKFHYTWAPEIHDANYSTGADPDHINFRGDDGSLVEALRSNCEVMISSSSFMMVIDYELYDDVVDEYNKKYT